MASTNRKSNEQRSFEKLEQRHMLAANWGIDAIDATQAWQRGYTGQGVVVAVIDSGIDLHPDLNGSLWTNVDEKLNTIDDDDNGYVNDMNGWDFAEQNNTPLTRNRHGNHVIGIIAAANNDQGTTGVAYNAKVMPLRVFDDAGNSSTRYIADAIRYAADNGADVINLSFDGIATGNVEAAIRYAGEKNALVVAASGNGGESEPSFPASASGELSNVISVGAHDSQFRRWTESNSAGGNGIVQVDAPGVAVQSASTNGEYGSSTGTSSAAAHVAGVAALILSAKPNLTPSELRDIIVRGATQRVANSDSVGAVNANRSISLIVQSPAQTPVVSADFDRSGSVDFTDFIQLARNFGENDKAFSHGDANGDGVVNFADFLIFSRTFQQKSPPPPAAVDAAIAQLDVTDIDPPHDSDIEAEADAAATAPLKVL